MPKPWLQRVDECWSLEFITKKTKGFRASETTVSRRAALAGLIVGSPYTSRA